MNNKTILLAACLLAVVAGVTVRAWAEGIPTQTPLVYSGVLQTTAGAPITTAQSIQLSLWDDSAATAGANQKCVTATQSITPDAQGRFRITLDQQCLSAVRSAPNLWVQLQVGATVLPRTKLNAVPYAVEAGSASRVVVGDGGVRTTVDGVFCGTTASVTGAVTAAGGLTGYRAAKRLCEQSCGSATAHHCTGVEIVRSQVLGMTNGMPEGWIMQGHYALFGTTTPFDDCAGFTDGSATPVGATGMASGPGNVRACPQSFPLLCCD